MYCILYSRTVYSKQTKIRTRNTAEGNQERNIMNEEKAMGRDKSGVQLKDDLSSEKMWCLVKRCCALQKDVLFSEKMFIVKDVGLVKRCFVQ